MVRHYTVTHTGDHKWVVSVDGEEMMVCKHKSDAVKAAKDVNELLDHLTIRKTHSCFVSHHGRGMSEPRVSDERKPEGTFKTQADIFALSSCGSRNT
jgi:hypothetical protein